MERVALLALSLMLLSGCQTVTQSASLTSPDARRQVLMFAAADGPVLLRAVNPPFPEGDNRTSEVSADYATGAVRGMDVSFTHSSNAAGRPQYYVVLAFDAPPGADSNDLCRAWEAPLPFGRRAGEQRLQAAFCSSGAELGGVELRMPAPGGLGAAEYRSAVRTVVSSLFDASDSPPRGERGSLGALVFKPSPGIRINPFEGIFD